MSRWAGQGSRRPGERGGPGSAADGAETGEACARGAGDAPCVHYWLIREDWVQECARCGAIEPVARPGFGEPRAVRDVHHPMVKHGHRLFDLRPRGILPPLRSGYRGGN